MVLDSEPTVAVTVTVAAGTRARPCVTPAILTFTTMTWDTAQTVTVAAGSDPDMEKDNGLADPPRVEHGRQL